MLVAGFGENPMKAPFLVITGPPCQSKSDFSDFDPHELAELGQARVRLRAAGGSTRRDPVIHTGSLSVTARSPMEAAAQAPNIGC
jgi:hypothetical protein